MSSGSNSRGSRGSQSLKNFAASSSPASKRDDISELYGDDHADALWIGKTLLNSKGIMSRFVFTHKAIWCAELIQSNILTDIGCFGSKVLTLNKTPYLQHWAFVARGTIPGLEDTPAYFVAQFGEGDYIPTAEEKKKNPDSNNFHALLVENDKRYAALQICSTKERSRVWVKLKRSTLESIITGYIVPYANSGDILQHPGGVIVSKGFDPKEWVTMDKPLKLGELNELMFETESAGKKYVVASLNDTAVQTITNNCQTFASSLYDLAK